MRSSLLIRESLEVERVEIYLKSTLIALRVSGDGLCQHL